VAKLYSIAAANVGYTFRSAQYLIGTNALERMPVSLPGCDQNGMRFRCNFAPFGVRFTPL